MLTLLRKLGKILRGGVAARQIFMGGLLGVVIGMIPGVNLTLFAAILLLVLLNAHIGIAVLALIAGKLFAILFAPVSYRIGYFIIHDMGIEGFFAKAADTPVLALCDLHVYCLTGALPVAIVLGIALGAVLARIVQRLRKGIVEATERSPKMEKLAANPIVRFFLWIVFGKRKGDLRETMEKRGSLLRKSGLILVVIVFVAAVALELLLADDLLRVGLEKGLGAAVGAECNVDEVDLSLLGGKLELRGLAVTNPDKPTHNAFQADRIAADLSVASLLAKRVVIDEIAAATVDTNAERATPGEVYRRKRDEKAEPEKPAPSTEDIVLRVRDLFERAETYEHWLRRAHEYLTKARDAADKQRAEKETRPATPRERLAEKGREVGYFSLSAKGLLPVRPTWVIRRLSAEKIDIDDGIYSLAATELSSHPGRHDQPVGLRFTPNGADEPVVGLDLHFEQADALHRLLVDLSGVPIDGALALSDDLPIEVKQGRAAIDIDGRFGADALDLPFSVDARDLELASREGETLLGMDAETTRLVLDSLEQIGLSGRIEGSLLSPRFVLDREATLAKLSEALAQAGKRALLNRARDEWQQREGELMDKAKESLGDQVPEGAVDEAADTVKGALGKLRPGQKDAEPTPEGEPTPEDEKKSGGLLDGLF